ncbi:MAG: hypothetical protein KGO53_12830 [Alphaproteobacteria bacterium]|nr:hypothetical protein [Alphaproteobacteria bacterium]
MARNDITLDQINARLGGGNRPVRHEAVEGAEAAPARTATGPQGFGRAHVASLQPSIANDEEAAAGAEEGEENTTLYTALFGTSAVIMLVVGFFYFMPEGFSLPSLWGGKGKAEAQATVLPSSVDEQCKLKDWVSGTMNNNIMHCYLTTSVSRLCDEAERKALVATIARFQDDHDTFDRDLNAAALGMAVGTPLSDKMQLGLEAAKADTAKTDEEKLQHLEAAQGMANKMMAGADAVLARQTYIHFQIGDLQNDLQKLGERGLISVSDFPYSHPDWVSAALQDVKVSWKSCSK